MLERLLRQVKERDSESFIALIKQCITMMDKQISNAIVNNGYAEVDRDNIIIIGDLHGDLEALESILIKSKFFDRDSLTIIFLGDYGDRGKESVEVYNIILNLKVRFFDRVILLLGNHEYLELPFTPHDLPLMLYEKFGNKAEIIYNELKVLFSRLYYTIVLNKKYLILHGGVPININSKEDFVNRKNELMEQILWNDPREEIKDYIPSLRGYGYYFGRDVTINALNITDTSLLIRAHEVCNGYKTNHNGRVLTIFSTKNVYGNKYGAYLKIDENTDLNNIIESIEVF
jgi:protein phosphatase